MLHHTHLSLNAAKNGGRTRLPRTRRKRAGAKGYHLNFRCDVAPIKLHTIGVFGERLFFWALKRWAQFCIRPNRRCLTYKKWVNVDYLRNKGVATRDYIKGSCPSESSCISSSSD